MVVLVSVSRRSERESEGVEWETDLLDYHCGAHGLRTACSAQRAPPNARGGWKKA